MGLETHIPAILKLRQILRQMLRADMDMRPIDPAFHSGPEPFDSIGRSAVEADIFVRAVVDRHMPVTTIGQAKVGAQFIGVDRAAGDHVSIDHWEQSGAALVGDNRRHHVPAALDHTQHNRLGGAESADESFVDLDVLAGTANRSVAVHVAHVFADFMAHAPRRLVGHAELALDFLGGNPVPRGAEQKHDMEPVAQRSAGALKRSVGHRGNLIAAILA